MSISVDVVLVNSVGSSINDGISVTIDTTLMVPGDSAYQVALNNGFVGTEAEWLLSLASGTPDWNGLINKPSTFPPSTHSHVVGDITGSGTAITKNFPVSGNAASEEVVLGSDTRLSDPRIPTTHSHTAGDVTQDASNRFVSDTEKSTWNGKQAALGFTPENVANKNQVNGYAGLSALSEISKTQVPVLDYLRFDPTASTPSFAEGKLFYDSVTKGISFYTDISGSTANMPYEVWTRVRNSTGSSIANGSPVVITGATGQTPTISLADANIHHPYQCIGLMTNDIINNATNVATIIGEIRDVNTNGSGANKLTNIDEVWADGDILYVSQTAGKLTNVKPTYPAKAIVVGSVSHAHGVNGKILVSIGDASNYFTSEQAEGKVNMTGFPQDTNNAYLCNLTYNETTRTVTITPTSASFDVWIKGVKYTKTGVQSIVHSAVGSARFIYYDETGTLVDSAIAWDLIKHAPVCYIFQDVTNSRRIPFEERHLAGRDVYEHRKEHTNTGTRVAGSPTITGYTLNDGTTDAAVTFAVGSCDLWDEELKTTTQSLPDAGPYTLLWRSGASGDWMIDRSLVRPFFDTGTALQYNQFTGATWQKTTVTEDFFVNYWVFGVPALPTTSITPAPTTTQQLIIISGQAIFASEALAHAESPASLSWGSAPFQEIAPLYQVTYRHNASAPLAFSNTAKCAITRVVRVIGTAASITQAAQTDHGALSGNADDDHLQYGMANPLVAAVTYNAGSTTTITLDGGRTQLFTTTAATGATTWAIANPPPAGKYGRFLLDLTNGGSQAQTFTGVKQVGGAQPALTVSGKDRLLFEWDGTQWTMLLTLTDWK